MPRSVRYGSGGEGGGGGLRLRVPPDIFTGNNRGAAETARNTYFADTDHAADLASFQSTQYQAIILRWTGAKDQWQTYLPGKEGIAYAAADWLDRSDITTGEQIAALLDAYIGNVLWQYQLSGAALVAAIDAATTNEDWRQAPIPQLTVNQIIALLNGELGSGWQDPQLTTDQVQDIAGALIATLSAFTYNAATNTLSVDLPQEATNSMVDAVSSTDTDLDGIQAAAQAALDDDRFITVRKSVRLLQRVIKTASTTLRGVVLLARREDVEETETDTSRVLTVATAKLLIDRVAPSGSGPGPEPTPSDTMNHCGISADTDVSATELAAATSGTSNALAVPTYVGDQYVFFLRPADAGAVTSVYIYQQGHRNTVDVSAGFNALDVTLGGIRYLGIISKAALASAANTIFEVA